MTNRLDEETRTIDEMLEPEEDAGTDVRMDEDLAKEAARTEKILGVPTERYIDSIEWEQKPDGTLGTAEHSKEKMEIDNRIVNEGTDLRFDPEYAGLNLQQRTGGMLHEYIHAADFNDDLARLMRDIGFSPDLTYELMNYKSIGEDRQEAVTEFLARTINPNREEIIHKQDEQWKGLQAYEIDVRELVSYLNGIGSLPEGDRVYAIKQDSKFAEEQEVEYVDIDDKHYIETGTYRDRDGREKKYAILLGDDEEVAGVRDNINASLYDDIVSEEEIEDYLGQKRNNRDNDDDDYDGGDDLYDPIERYAEKEDTEYTLGQGPTAELYSPEVMIGAEPGNQPAVQEPMEAGVAESDYAEAGV